MRYEMMGYDLKKSQVMLETDMAYGMPFFTQI